MLGRQRETIKARTSVSVPFKGIWMRAYPIIGCLHPSCYHRGQGYPTEIPINSTGKQQRGVEMEGCVCVCVLDRGFLSSFQHRSDRSAGSSDWTVYISGPSRLYRPAQNTAISQAVKRWTKPHLQLMIFTGQTLAWTQSGRKDIPLFHFYFHRAFWLTA